MKPVIAIDGPAASGKGTLSRSLAKELNYGHMDTGALYRAVAFELLESGDSSENREAAINAAETLRQKLSAQQPDKILDNQLLRHDRIGQTASKIAVIQDVRDILFNLQRHFAQNPGNGFDGAVLDGRDIGTVICPDAAVKLFITAETAIRAERRLKELQSKEIPATYEAVLEDMRARDARDQGRKAAPTKPADDAIVLDTSHLSEREVLKKALEIVHNKIRATL